MKLSSSHLLYVLFAHDLIIWWNTIFYKMIYAFMFSVKLPIVRESCIANDQEANSYIASLTKAMT